MGMIRSSFSCDEKVIEKIDEIAEKEGRSRSSLVTRILNSYVNEKTKGKVKGRIQRAKSRNSVQK